MMTIGKARTHAEGMNHWSLSRIEMDGVICMMTVSAKPNEVSEVTFQHQKTWTYLALPIWALMMAVRGRYLP